MTLVVASNALGDKGRRRAEPRDLTAIATAKPRDGPSDPGSQGLRMRPFAKMPPRASA